MNREKILFGMLKCTKRCTTSIYLLMWAADHVGNLGMLKVYYIWRNWKGKSLVLNMPLHLGLVRSWEVNNIIAHFM